MHTPDFLLEANNSEKAHSDKAVPNEAGWQESLRTAYRGLLQLGFVEEKEVFADSGAR
jgi:hypothetical protein